MTITALPAAPARSDTPANFIAKADAFVAALPTMVTQFNADIVTLNNLAAGFSSRTSATSWTVANGSKTFTLNNQTGLFPLGSQVVVARTSAPGTVFAIGTVTSYATDQLGVNLYYIGAGGGAGPYTDWTISSTGAVNDSNAFTTNTQSISSDLTLTSSSARMQVLTATAYGCSIKLPDATTMVLSTKGIELSVQGGWPIGIRNNAGTLLRVVNPGGVVSIFPSDVSSAAGIWQVKGSGITYWLQNLDRTLVDASATGSSAGTQCDHVLQLSATLVVYAARDNAGTSLRLTAHDLSTNTIGTPLNVGSWPNQGDLSMFAVSATGGICLTNSNASTTKGVAFTVSGTTVSAGSIATSTFGTCGFQGAQETAKYGSLGSGVFVVFGGHSDNLTPAACVWTVSGTTITQGSNTALGAAFGAAPQFQYVIARSATQVMFIAYDSTGLITRVAHCTISGTTITHNNSNDTTTYAASMRYGAPILMQTDEWWFYSYIASSTTFYMTRITVSGTTVTLTRNSLGTASMTSMNWSLGGNTLRAQSLVKLDATHAVASILAASNAWDGLYVTWGGASFTLVETLASNSGITNGTSGANTFYSLGTLPALQISFEASDGSAPMTVLPAISFYSVVGGKLQKMGSINISLVNNEYHLLVFYGGRVIAINGPRYEHDVVVADVTSFVELSRGRVIKGGNGVIGGPLLIGAKVIMPWQSPASGIPYIGLYVNIIEICAA